MGSAPACPDPRHAAGLLAAGISLLGPPVPAAPAVGAVPRIAAAARAAGLRPGDYALLAVEVGGGVVASHRPDAALRPASNMKLVVAAAALARLGPDAAFRTELRAAGPIRGGVLEGDLVAVGGGDPTISSRYEKGGARAVLDGWARALFERGIRAIRGAVRVDDDLFDAERYAPGWPPGDIGKVFAAPVGALTLEESCVAVRVAPGPRPGAPARIAIEPPCGSIPIRNAAVTVAGKARRIVVRRPPERDAIRVSGRIGIGAGPGSYAVPVADPGRVFGAALRAALARKGIRCEGGVVRGKGPAGSRLLLARTVPLARTLPALLKHSQNLHGEVLLELLGARVRGEGSFSAGAEAVAGYLRSLGLELEGIRIRDGSGLSHENRLSPRAIVAVLCAVRSLPAFPAFRDALAVGGVDGTLARWFTSGPLRGKVLAKTGSLAGVKALSGYIVREGRAPIAFSILCDPVRRGSWKARRFQERACEMLAGRVNLR